MHVASDTTERVSHSLGLTGAVSKPISACVRVVLEEHLDLLRDGLLDDLVAWTIHAGRSSLRLCCD